MRTSSFLVLAVLLVLGTLAVQAAVSGVPYTGQGVGKGHVPDKEVVKGQHPVKRPGQVQTPQRGHTKPGVCPRVLMRCAMLNPPNACLRDSECHGAKKCCMGSCGRACLNPQ
ncbi:PREDICTED: elafin [Miniopterus natalensis]|uniref:elafin n=1 Tax=Miniopterus natalensis TaxID=291302 RepID=UPI0007A6F9E9|nr:PREDICTED: elafin [Miniopterus natalensis]